MRGPRGEGALREAGRILRGDPALLCVLTAGWRTGELGELVRQAERLHYRSLRAIHMRVENGVVCRRAKGKAVEGLRSTHKPEAVTCKNCLRKAGVSS